MVFPSQIRLPMSLQSFSTVLRCKFLKSQLFGDHVASHKSSLQGGHSILEASSSFSCKAKGIAASVAATFPVAVQLLRKPKASRIAPIPSNFASWSRNGHCVAAFHRARMSRHLPLPREVISQRIVSLRVDGLTSQQRDITLCASSVVLEPQETFTSCASCS